MNDDPTTPPCRSTALGLAWAVALTCAAVTAPALAQTTAPASRPVDAALSNAVAERLAAAADRAEVRGDDASLRAAAALLDLARARAPREARFARASADVLMRLGERDRAIDALAKLRAIDPNDQLAMIQFVDLTLAGMETADARAAYAERVMTAGGVADEVRSHAADQLMAIRRERGQDAEATAAMDAAIALNPLNATALEAKYRVLSTNGAKAGDRVRTLAQLIQASPGDPGHWVTLAQECVLAGDYGNAASCYRMAFGLIAANGQNPPADDVADYVATELVAGRTEAAGAMLDQATHAIPDDGRFFSLDLLQALAAGAKPDAIKDQVAAARGVYLARVAGISTLLNHPEAKTLPTTNPAPPLPDVAADAAKLKAAPDGDPAAQLEAAYAAALAELTWFDLFFQAAPVEDARLDALRALLGDDAPVVTRFEGWRLLDANKPDEARLKFDAVADRDGFARLGQAAVAVARQDDAAAKKIVGELYATRPTGVYAAHVALAGQRLGVPAPTTGVDTDVSNVASTARFRLGGMLDRPRENYLLTAELPGVSFGYGEPILAKLSLLNTSREPISIGPRGFVSGTYVIDAQIRGTNPEGFPATVVGQWGGAVRLQPRQSITRVVRLDQGALGDYLRDNPEPLVMLSAFATSNAVAGQRGSAIGPGGEQTQVGEIFERRTSPVQIEAFRAKLLAQLKGQDAAARVAAADLIGASLAAQSRTPSAATTSPDAASAPLQDALAKQAGDESDPLARAWIAAYAAGPSAEALAKVVGGDADAAAAALAIVADRPSAERKAVARAVAAGGAAKDGPLAELAAAEAAMPDPQPATQPAR